MIDIFLTTLSPIVKIFGKNVALSFVKRIVTDKKDNIVYWCYRISIWMDKIQKVLDFLRSLKDRLQDGILTDDEISQTISDAKLLATDVTSKVLPRITDVEKSTAEVAKA